MFWKLANLLAAPFLLTVAQANAPVPATPVQQEVNYVDEVQSDLVSTSFSTDVREGQVAAEHDELKNDGDLSAVIINRKTCADVGYHLTYRIALRNRGDERLRNISVQNKYPEGVSVVNEEIRPAGADHDEEERTLTWKVENLAPGQHTDFTFTLFVNADVTSQLVNDLTVDYFIGDPPADDSGLPPDIFRPAEEQGPRGQVLTDHVIYGSCYDGAGAVSEEEDEDPEEFSIAILPDTQKYARFYPATFAAQTQWIAENAEEDKENIKFVIHEGDIVDKNTKPEWEVAVKSMSALDDVVPYAVLPGNHDMGPESFDVSATTRDTTLYNKYFPLEKYRQFETFEGVYEPGKYDNNYHAFRQAGVDWLVLSLEFAPRDTVLAWADDVIKNHANHRVIIATHNYLSSEGKPTRGNIERYGLTNQPEGANDGEGMWNKLVKKHPNIMFVFSGHVKATGIGRRVATGDHGNKVYEMVANYQFEENGGNGYLRIVTISPEAGTIKVRTFSPVLNIDRGGDHEFEFEDVDFGLPDPTNTLPSGGDPVLGDPVPTKPRDQFALPAIICHAALIDCQAFKPQLGQRFETAKSLTICGDRSINPDCQPDGAYGELVNSGDLPLRFAEESRSDLLPGECRVLQEDLTQYFESRDFNRRGSASTFVLHPLESVYQQLEQHVFENYLVLGVQFSNKINQELRPFHLAFWEEVQALLEDILAGDKDSFEAVPGVRAAREKYLGQVKDKQEDFTREFSNLLALRERQTQKLVPDVGAAARLSIQRACAVDNRDQGAEVNFRSTLPISYGGLYGYGDAHQHFRLEGDFNPIGPEVRPEAFDQELQQIMGEFEQGNDGPLRQLIAEIPDRERIGFDAAFEATYESASDSILVSGKNYLRDWNQRVLQPARSYALACEYENIASAPLETTWCESNNYPQFIIKGAPNPSRNAVDPVAPPDLSDLVGGDEDVDEDQTEGQACRGLPGDPHWAADCSCQCGDLLPDGDNFVSCQSQKNITLHDISVTSTAECILQRDTHGPLGL